jgi:transcriptional regulator with XRE-family HTH domain
MATFGERLHQLREIAKMTQEGLARATGLSVSAVSKLEQRSIDPSWSTVQKMAKALGVTCEAFAECEDMTDGKKTASRGPRKRKR